MNRRYRLHARRKAEGKAFTLLELIVVLLVLGVLAAIAVPTYNTLKTNSVDRSVNTTLDAIARAGEAAYISDPLMTDAQVAAASIEGLTADDDAGTPGYQQGDRTITLDGSEVTVSLSSGTIDREGSVSFSSGISSVTYAGASGGGGPVVTVPGAPSITSLTAGDTTLSVAFTAPGSDGGSAITDYEYALDGGSWVSASTTSSPFTISGLTNGTAYQVQLRAVNAVGTGSASAATSGTPGVTPSQVTGLTVLPGDGQATLSWTAPASEGTSSITDYTVAFATASGGPWTVFADGISSATGATVTGLTANTAYWFQVSAVNAIGSSPTVESASGSLTQPAVGAVYSATTGGWYLNVDSSGDQATAAAAAATAGGQLASINSGEEWLFVRNLVNDDVWLGATDTASEGTWVNADGTLVGSTYMRWSAAEPNNFSTSMVAPANCLRMDAFGSWWDESCAVALPGYVIEWR